MVDGGVGVPIFQVGVTWLRTGDSLRSHRVVGWGVEVRSGSLERLCPWLLCWWPCSDLSDRKASQVHGVGQQTGAHPLSALSGPPRTQGS